LQTTVRARQLAKGIFYGWWVVLGAFISQLLNGALLLHSFTTYFLPLQAEFGWSRTLISGAFSIARAESGILGPLQGWMLDRFGPRAVIRVGVVLFGVGFILFSRMDSVLTFYLSFALMALGSSLSGFMSVSATVAQWFSRRRSIALGIAMSGMGVGGLLVPLIAWSLNSFGWRTVAMVSGVIILMVGLPAAQLMRHKPEQYGYLPDGQTTPGISGVGNAAQVSEDSEFTTRQALRTASFWLISVGHAFALLMVGAALLHQVPHMVQAIGLSLEMAGAVVAILVGVNVLGQLAGGYLGDRIDKRSIIVACMWLHAIALTIFAFADTLFLAITFAILHGAAWGVRGPLIHSLRADYFGRGSYATIMGFSSFIIMIGMMTGPIFAGVMADLTGTYTMGFLILAALAALGSVFFFLAKKPQLPS